MSIKIEDGKGQGYSVGVNSENRILTESVSASVEHHTNHHEKQAYNVYFEQSPTANDDCIFYMVNNSSDADICIEGIWLDISAACDVYFKINDKGTRGSATALTPANLNGGSGHTADGTFEKGADLESGTLSGGTEFQRFSVRAAISTTSYNFEQDLILPKNSTMTIYCSASTATVKGTVIFNFHSKEQG